MFSTFLELGKTENKHANQSAKSKYKELIKIKQSANQIYKTIEEKETNIEIEIFLFSSF